MYKYNGQKQLRVGRGRLLRPQVYVTTQEFARRAGVRERWLRGALKGGRLRGVKQKNKGPYGYRWMVEETQVERARLLWLESRTRQANGVFGFSRGGVNYRHDGGIRRKNGVHSR